MLNFKCSCGSKLKFNPSGTVIHTINNKEIKVLRVPHYKCIDCRQVNYDITQVKILPILEFAIENYYTQVDYNLWNR